MSLYAIGDTHLSFGCAKPMDVFGGRWENYVEKLREGLSVLTDDDVCVICDDISWGMSLQQALPDFQFLDGFPGRKLLLKGNHDYWWGTRSSMESFLTANGLRTLEFLHNSCSFYGGTALCGTRGWFYEEEKGEAHDRKIMLREVGRLEASLRLAGDAPKICFLHYPPKYDDYECPELLDVMECYGVHRCIYGHIHGYGHARAFRGTHRGVSYELASADYLSFRPLRLI